jgi:hypothetical protein
MKRFCFVFLFLIATNNVWAIQPIIIPGADVETRESALLKLKSITLDSRYKACKQDLISFIESLSPADEAELVRQQSKFDAAALAKLATTKSRLLGAGKTSDVSVNKKMSSVHFLITHEGFKCQISIYPSMEDDGIKANIDPTAADVIIKVGSTKTFEVPATLVGVSSNAKRSATIQTDPSKVLSILGRRGITQLKEQIAILEDFHEWEAKSSSPGASPSGTPPPK